MEETKPDVVARQDDIVMAEAVQATNESVDKDEEKQMKKAKSNKNKRIGIVALVLGLIVCAVGLAVLIVNLTAQPGLRDAEYLTSIGKWQKSGEPAVVWDFTEVGKGTLTTNAHANDYNFLWEIEGDTLKVETSWLYTLNDEYTYELDQDAKTLTLTAGTDKTVFVPVVDDGTGAESRQ